MNPPILAACLLLAAATPAAWAQGNGAAPPPADEAAAPATLADAYAELAAGRDRAAERGFLALAADAAPDDGGPVLGAGLAAAAAGNHRSAVQRIRAALLRGPGALTSLPGGGEALAGRLRVVRSSLEEGLLSAEDPSGLLVASAAIDYLLGELETSRMSLAAAVRRDGLQAPMRALDRLIQDARFAGRDGSFVAPVFAAVNPDAPATPEAARTPEDPAAPGTTTSPGSPGPAALGPGSAPPAAPRLLRPVTAAERAARPGVFLDYDKLNRRVSEMAGSLESFEHKLLRSLMTGPVDPPAPPAPPAPPTQAPAAASAPAP